MQRDDFNPLAFGDAHQPVETDVLKDFSDWWSGGGLDASPPQTKSFLSPVAQQRFHHHDGSGGVSHVSSETTETTSLRRGGSSSVSWTSPQPQRSQSNDLLSAVSNETDDASRSSVKRRRTATAGFQPLARVKENNAAGGQEEEVRPWMVEVRDHDVVLGECVQC